MTLRTLHTLALLATSFWVNSSWAQVAINPSEGAVLNFTQILFEIPAIPNAETYEFLVFPHEGDDPIARQIDSSSVAIFNRLEFDISYRWKVIARDKKGAVQSTSKEYHFSIASPDPEKNTQRFPVRTQNAQTAHDQIRFLDYSRVAINSEGEIIWHLPENEKYTNQNLRNLSMTDRGTLTFLSDRDCQEISLTGVPLWIAPRNANISGDTLEYYHHEFKRLSNGNYMVLGKSYADQEIDFGDQIVSKVPLSSIIEFNAQGDTVWTWISDRYITVEDIRKEGAKVKLGNTYGHMNSFYFDEPSGLIYASFRDINTIIVIDKASKRVLRSYGDKVPSDSTKTGRGTFRKQHAAIPLSENRILLFNNNNRGKTSSVQIISETSSGNSISTLLWEFSCDFDTLMPGASDRMGNAQPLPNGNYLVNMGYVARIFEVTPEKEIVWDCTPETWNSKTLEWEAQSNYRVFAVSSLYPCYFSTAIENENTKEAALKLVNEGSEPDTYRITISVGKPKSKKRISTTISIDAENKQTIPLKSMLKKYPVKKALYISVQSVKNPDLVRKITLNHSKNFGISVF